VCWATITHDCVAHKNDTRTTSCRQGSHAGAQAPFGDYISLCPASASYFLHLMQHRLHAMDGMIA
jgi:hypothetical protein